MYGCHWKLLLFGAHTKNLYLQGVADPNAITQHVAPPYLTGIPDAVQSLGQSWIKDPWYVPTCIVPTLLLMLTFQNRSVLYCTGFGCWVQKYTSPCDTFIYLELALLTQLPPPNEWKYPLCLKATVMLSVVIWFILCYFRYALYMS